MAGMIRLIRDTVEVIDDPPLPDLWQMHDLARRGFCVSVMAGPGRASCVVWDEYGGAVVEVGASTPEAALTEAWRRMRGC